MPDHNGDIFTPLQLYFFTHLVEGFIIYCCSLRLRTRFGKKWMIITIKMVETKKYEDITSLRFGGGKRGNLERSETVKNCQKFATRILLRVRL